MEDPKPQIDLLEARLGHQFGKRDLLLSALTHRSLKQPSGAGNNERLEFLGDAVLGLVVGEALFNDHPEWQEGELTRVRAQLVSRRHLGEVARAIGLGQFLLLNKNEEKAGLREKATVLSNCMEAVIAALYLDGGLDRVREFAHKRILAEAERHLAEELRAGQSLGNFKSALQELLQGMQLGSPVYQLKSAIGPDHRKQFQVEVSLCPVAGSPGQMLARGHGSTKKAAEQEAARLALHQVQRGMEHASTSGTGEGASGK